MEHVILISDYPEELKRDLEWEKKKLHESLGEEYKVEVYPSENVKFVLTVFYGDRIPE